MSAKIIDPDRYKKTTRKEIEKKKKNNKAKNSIKAKKANDLRYKKKKIKLKKEEVKKEQEKKQNQQRNKIKTHTKNYESTKNVKRKKTRIPTVFKASIVILLIVAIGFISKKIVNFENMPILNVFSNKDNENLQKDYDMRLGISKLDTTDVLNSKNIILNELNNLVNKRLLSINKDYTINYLNLEKIEKVSNKTYLLYLSKSSDITFDVLKGSIEKIKANTSNAYYSNVANIENIEKENEYIKITLANDDPYFVYRLDFPLYEVSNSYMYQILDKSDSSLSLSRKDSESTLKTISLTNYQDTDDMVADFREDKIDMFFASSDSIMQMIGKHEYNVKKYRDGQNVFLLGNKDSEIFKLKEVRKALAYSIKRENIVKEINNSFSEIIDLPFIYSSVKYKYDIYGAENELLSNGWQKKNGVYQKSINGNIKTLELSLLVNEEDSTKNEIATMIKQMAENVGIKININVQKKEEFENKLKNKEYDIILADVYVNQYPDIEFLKEYVNLNDTINNAFEQVYNSSTKEDLEKNIVSLQDTMSAEVACIGILARNSNVVYQKYITGFDYTNYMMVFEDLNSIGKISEDENE